MNEWNCHNFQLKLEEIMSLSKFIRNRQTQMIKCDFKSWLFENFYFSDIQLISIDSLPDNFLEETGLMLSRAIQKKYPISVFVADDSIGFKNRKNIQIIDASWSTNQGFYVEYSFTF